MSFQFRMDQVLDYKHHEKERTHKEYMESQTVFEEVGYELYGLLKKKEILIEEQSQRIQHGEQVRNIQQINYFIDRLDGQVKLLQMKLQQARDNMNQTHERLVSQTIDVKKYEKLKEKQFGRYQEYVKSEETKITDELAVLRHTTNGIR